MVDHVPDDVEVAYLAQSAPVPGQLGPQGGAPRRIEQEPEGPQVGADAAHGHPALMDPLGLGLRPLEAVQFAGDRLRPQRPRAA